ncbi:chitobiase/beta-hexosaminidase C-terminal domain-containing protein [Methanobacterium sp.]|uniref:chitobiase/beta-hexosaminidase C-terminal domain-containing protein n=1 Tax=Methanobacterium sp. TaxID=2164 RepID=UPI0025D32729|nr:chitobiase/beta-hexosaminidase C-terminal domain-containing protein [Methanobacterium sp.]MBI5458805.1 chitobiase/beta-hexosaminidase C-terminal domain-containing protein [Methanobacterium sp.]
MGKTKRISILLMIGVILCISTVSTVAAEDNSNMAVISPNRDVNLSVSNDNGTRFDNNGNDSYNFFNTLQGSSQGMNELHITNDSGNAYGSVVSSNDTSGTFYVSNTGGRGWNDAGIIMVAINGTIRDNFALTITTSGYTWVPVDKSSTPAYSALTYNLVALNETFYKSDFIYGPQIWKPAPGPNNYNVPIFYGQDMTNTTNTFSILFIDLYAGILKSSLYSGLMDNGMIKVQYTIVGLSGGQMVSFNVYGYSNDSNQGQGIRWTNRIVDSGSSGYTVTGTDFTAPTVQASPNTGTYNTVQSVTLSADEPATIYYTTDGSDPTTSSNQYTAPININTTTTLKFMAIDTAGNQGTTQTETYTIDTTAPTIQANPSGGNYNTAQSVVLTADDESATTIYYTTDGTTPTTTSTQYTTPININTTTTLKFMAIDTAGNQGTVQTETYNIDTTAPTIQANPTGGNYNTAQTITLTPNETATIYYTTDGTTPTTTSTQYTTPININTTTTLKFMAIDTFGNQGTVQTETYNIKSDVYVQITPSITNPTVGDQVTYTFKLGNNGPGDAHNIVFTYVIPEGVEYAGANVDQGTVNYDLTTRTLTWTVGSVAAGVDPYLWLNLNIQSAGTYNILPTVTVAGYNPGLTNNIGTLQVTAAPKTSTENTSSPTNTETVNAATTTQTIPMKTTGMPITALISALFMIGSGLALSRKN